MRITTIILLVASFYVSQYSCEGLSDRELTTSPRFRKLKGTPEQGTGGGPGATSNHPSQRSLRSAVVESADDNAKKGMKLTNDDRKSSKEKEDKNNREKEDKNNREEEKRKGYKGINGGKSGQGVIK